MVYQNRNGEAFYILNFQSIEIDHPSASIQLFPIGAKKESNIEWIPQPKKLYGDPAEFINWLLIMLLMEKQKTTWTEYLEYREKVLPKNSSTTPPTRGEA